ncbi:DoxX-like family protein [Duganella sp. CF517]|uniref:DoxX family protein n=1 Tax=Duganella sp. CF517 TaxID=1881038 RepID=UPI0008BFF4D1|nr:DoxX family protein [Duganella sp. CF517]SEO06316.1 DoxX-like family protein [Duganella sp. CF517]
MTSFLLPADNRYLSAGLWLAQIAVALVFAASGLTKLFMPIAELTAMMTWPGDYPLPFVRAIGMVDLLGAAGVLLPSLTRIRPWLTVLAAGCCVLLQILAIGFHASRGEFSVLPLNFVLLPLCVLVLWGRGKSMPIKERTASRE